MIEEGYRTLRKEIKVGLAVLGFNSIFQKALIEKYIGELANLGMHAILGSQHLKVIWILLTDSTEYRLFQQFILTYNCWIQLLLITNQNHSFCIETQEAQSICPGSLRSLIQNDNIRLILPLIHLSSCYDISNFLMNPIRQNSCCNEYISFLDYFFEGLPIKRINLPKKIILLIRLVKSSKFVQTPFNLLNSEIFTVVNLHDCAKDPLIQSEVSSDWIIFDVLGERLKVRKKYDFVLKMNLSMIEELFMPVIVVRIIFYFHQLSNQINSILFRCFPYNFPQNTQITCIRYSPHHNFLLIFDHQLTQTSYSLGLTTTWRTLYKCQCIFTHFFKSHVLLAIQIHLRIECQLSLAGNDCDFLINELFYQSALPTQGLIIEFQTRKDRFMNSDRRIFLSNIVAFRCVHFDILRNRMDEEFRRLVRIVSKPQISIS